MLTLCPSPGRYLEIVPLRATGLGVRFVGRFRAGSFSHPTTHTELSKIRWCWLAYSPFSSNPPNNKH
ncbi:putative hydrolase [Anopheles sinensis]|uniref:Putative hydrolase n=1 Tax=Anopheles sinensis TaxID=74873 RepID=A0A084W1G9_ANOSI|nr:putative hydrolase [Anopheles sinensis]